MTQSLVALDHNRIYLVITATGLLLNVLLNFWLIPEYGASGAAFSTVITEALIPLSCLPMILKNVRTKHRHLAMIKKNVRTKNSHLAMVKKNLRTHFDCIQLYTNP